MSFFFWKYCFKYNICKTDATRQIPKDMILNQATRAFVVSLTDRISDSLEGQKELRDERTNANK